MASRAAPYPPTKYRRGLDATVSSRPDLEAPSLCRQDHSLPLVIVQPSLHASCFRATHYSDYTSALFLESTHTVSRTRQLILLLGTQQRSSCVPSQESSLHIRTMIPPVQPYEWKVSTFVPDLTPADLPFAYIQCVHQHLKCRLPKHVRVVGDLVLHSQSTPVLKPRLGNERISVMTLYQTFKGVYMYR